MDSRSLRRVAPTWPPSGALRRPRGRRAGINRHAGAAGCAAARISREHQGYIRRHRTRRAHTAEEILRDLHLQIASARADGIVDARVLQLPLVPPPAPGPLGVLVIRTASTRFPCAGRSRWRPRQDPGARTPGERPDRTPTAQQRLPDHRRRATVRRVLHQVHDRLLTPLLAADQPPSLPKSAKPWQSWHNTPIAPSPWPAYAQPDQQQRKLASNDKIPDTKGPSSPLTSHTPRPAPPRPSQRPRRPLVPTATKIL
jgi:hypothetical protein